MSLYLGSREKKIIKNSKKQLMQIIIGAFNISNAHAMVGTAEKHFISFYVA